MLIHDTQTCITGAEMYQFIDRLTIETELTDRSDEQQSINQPVDETEQFDLYRLACDMLAGER